MQNTKISYTHNYITVICTKSCTKTQQSTIDVTYSANEFFPCFDMNSGVHFNAGCHVGQSLRQQIVADFQQRGRSGAGSAWNEQRWRIRLDIWTQCSGGQQAIGGDGKGVRLVRLKVQNWRSVP